MTLFGSLLEYVFVSVITGTCLLFEAQSFLQLHVDLQTSGSLQIKSLDSVWSEFGRFNVFLYFSLFYDL